jgi:hypothetical protein
MLSGFGSMTSNVLLRDPAAASYFQASGVGVEHFRGVLACFRIQLICMHLSPSVRGRCLGGSLCFVDVCMGCVGYYYYIMLLYFIGYA